MRITLNRRVAFRFWLTLLPAVVVLWYFPIIDFPIRVITWAGLLLILIGAVFFSWRLRVLPWLLLILYGAMALFLVWPSHRLMNRSALRSDYGAALKSYLGCRYVWGGEGYLGIDCSGFVRKALEDALATSGRAALDPARVRASIFLYWHDTNAKGLGEGADGTSAVTTCSSLNALDYSLLRSGDLAVTAGGDHVMAYLGNLTWIAADPGVGKVTIFTIPECTNAYFSTPMKIVRWQILDD